MFFIDGDLFGRTLCAHPLSVCHDGSNNSVNLLRTSVLDRLQVIVRITPYDGIRNLPSQNRVVKMLVFSQPDNPFEVFRRWRYIRDRLLKAIHRKAFGQEIDNKLRRVPAVVSDFKNRVTISELNDVVSDDAVVRNVTRRNTQKALTHPDVDIRILPQHLTTRSILLFGERPSAKQAAGILLVLATFCIMQLPQKRDGSSSRMKPAFGLLILGLLFSGMADSMLKVFEEYGNAALGDWFMGAAFLFSALLCLCITLCAKGRIGRNEIMIGLVLGIPNYLSSLLLLRSLSSISAYIAYPTYSVGAILAVAAASTLIFREKLSRWNRAGIALIIPAIILLNI